MIRVLDLFSGIGGFSYGLESCGGFKTVAFCENDRYARKVLAKHWPGVPIYDDVRSLSGERLRADGIVPDLICGGFPCQDLSIAGKAAGLSGARSSLWFDFARIIGEVGPRWVIVENVAALLNRGLDEILGALASFGFDAEWHCIPAAAIGAPHQRDRLWIIAYAARDRCAQRDLSGGPEGQGMADAGRRRATSYAVGSRLALGPGALREWASAATARGNRWTSMPEIRRVDVGFPYRVDRIRCLGNSLVPYLVSFLGRAILRAEAARGNDR